MELAITSIIKGIIFPPGVILIFFTLGMLLLKQKPRAAQTILWGTLTLGYLVSTPLCTHLLSQSITLYPALEEDEITNHRASAIVILSGSRYKDAPEYNGDTIGGDSLLRVRYGAYLHRKIKLPIIVSGGIVHADGGKTLAQTMADSLINDFNINNILLEEKSRTTGENAYYTKELLNSLNIDTIFLVTHSIHMQRAVTSFKKQGINVIPAPTIFTEKDKSWITLFTPSSYALYDNHQVLHEWLGIIWHKLRY